jgi:hypothetical protein
MTFLVNCRAMLRDLLFAPTEIIPVTEYAAVVALALPASAASYEAIDVIWIQPRHSRGG